MKLVVGDKVGTRHGKLQGVIVSIHSKDAWLQKPDGKHITRALTELIKFPRQPRTGYIQIAPENDYQRQYPHKARICAVETTPEVSAALVAAGIWKKTLEGYEPI
jgi:hypothetical protein